MTVSLDDDEDDGPEPEPERWIPDPGLIEAVLAATVFRKRMVQLTPADRAWVVAGLTHRGLTARQIKDRMRCSLRMVRDIKSKDLYQVCRMYLTEVEAFTGEQMLARSERTMLITRATEAESAAERYHRQLGNLVDKIASGTGLAPKCQYGHRLDRYNTYVRDDGRRQCRECQRKRQADYEARLRATAL